MESKSRFFKTFTELPFFLPNYFDYYFSGTYGLWLDGELYHGRTCPTKTFNNDRLTPNEDFIIASVEVWTFID